MSAKFMDLLTYTSNLPALRQELVEKGDVDESGNPFLNICMTPVQHNGEFHSVTLCRTSSDEEREKLNSYIHLEVLGTKEEVDADPEKTTKYEAAYSREPVTMTDPDTGEQITYTPPHWHGEFA
ncbi:hypothetical protein [Endozoicomonas sp. 2B-B]